MRASIIIASHNEGDTLRKTVESCIETSVDLDYEIVVADDASMDGSAEDVSRLFSQVRLYRHERRQGASPTKSLGARNARGNTLVFLDGHTQPQHGSISQLVQDVEALAGAAVITPKIVALDVQRWKADFTQAGHGYTLDLQTFDPRWQALNEMQSVTEGRTRFYTSPALIGCGFAVSRELYNKLWGFDVQMHYWGVEDLDFSLKCWLMGHRILHDPQAVIGHHFRDTFDNYSVPVEHLLVNQLRMARKNFTHAVWADWLGRCRQRNLGPLAEHPEGLWAHVWQLFESERASAEQERSYLHARRVHDEFWYAERFGLAWPRLQVDAGAVPSPRELFAVPSPSPKPTCKVTGINPANVKVFTAVNQSFTAQGTSLGSVQWTTNPSGTPATGTGQTFTTRWDSSGAKQVRASCGGTSATANVTVVPCDVILHLKNTGKVIPKPENPRHDEMVQAAGGVDTLGPLPMGQGRADFPGQAYTSPLIVIGTVVQAEKTLTFRWKRFLQRRSWFIRLNAAGTAWVVTQRTRLGFPTPADDTGAPIFNVPTPSPNLHLYIYDNSALAPGNNAADKVGDFIREEKDFLYRVDRNIGGNWIPCASEHVGQLIQVKRIATTGTTATDWMGLENSTAERTLDVIITEAKVRAMVGGALPIQIDPHAND